MTTPTVGSPTVGLAADNSPFGNPPLAHRRTAFGQASAPEGDAAADWQTRSPQPPWSSGDQVSPIWAPKEQPKASPPKAPQPGAAPVLPPRAWASPEQSSAPTSRAGSGPVAPTWFDRLNQPVDDPAARTGTDPAKADGPRRPSDFREPSRSRRRATANGGAAPAEVEVHAVEGDRPRSSQTSIGGDDDSPTATPAAADASDVDTDDDDWPTRYSWLEDDETEEAAEADKKPDVAEAGDRRCHRRRRRHDSGAETVAAKTAAPDDRAGGGRVPAEPAATDAALGRRPSRTLRPKTAEPTARPPPSKRLTRTRTRASRPPRRGAAPGSSPSSPACPGTTIRTAS